MARYGIGATNGRIVNAPSTSPSSGSGGAGTLPIGNLSFTSAQGELSDVTTGRITLGVVNLALIGLIAFYLWTRSAQGG
jgi:hypothetical protein